MSKSLRLDFWVILAIILISTPIILQFKLKPFISALLFFALPTAYLFLRKKKPLKRIITGSLLIGVGIGMGFDAILSANNAWNVPTSQLIFNYRIFGFWPAEEIIWFFFWALFILVFYEHFYDREKTGKISHRFKFIVFPVFAALFIILIKLAMYHNALHLNYAYFLLASPALIPITYVIKYYPNLFFKFFKTSIFFFVVYLIYEFTAVKLGQWYFTGQYIGWVDLMDLRFPLEELFFWMSLSSFTVLSIYEGFVDDSR